MRQGTQAGSVTGEADILQAEAAWLRRPQAIRQRCGMVMAAAEAGELRHFVLHPERIGEAADYVIVVTGERYPDFAIPYHSRWRHFAAAGPDRWATLARTLDEDADEIARIRFDLCVPSVFLDAGAGSDWLFEEPGRHVGIGRSEGLAIASFHAFCAGAFSADPEQPLRADAAALEATTPADIEAAFQARPGNPLIGVIGRASLMQALGGALRARPDLFGSEARIGNLYDTLKARAVDGVLAAEAILDAVIDGFGAIWPERLMLGGINLGDVWPHPAAVCDGPGGGLVPFHKLSQWLAYSLVEILEDAGVEVGGIDALTGLPEYRNGGLFIDAGVLSCRDPELASISLPVGHEAVVEWRALTVVLLDRLAVEVRDRLGRSAEELPLARILEGGTWAAGRRIAREKRADGRPPLDVDSDGTVF